MSKKLSGKALVIQLSSDKLRIAKTTLGAAMPQLQASFVADLPAGAVVDGVIHDLEKVREVLQGALATPELRRVKRVVFALCTTQVIAESTVLPPVALNKLDKMLEANMDMYFPVDTQNYHLTWQVVDKQNEKGEMVIQLWAVSTSIVRPYYALANSCGLSVVAIDYSIHALASAADASFAVPTGAKKSAVSALNKPLFSKKGGEIPEEQAAAVAVAESASTDTELYLMAENEHLQMIFVQDGQVKLQRMSQCGPSMEAELGEVVMALDYFESMNIGRYGAVRCILCGSMAEDENFVMLARDVLNIPVQVLPSLHGSEWTLCLGAARTDLDFGVPELNKPGGVSQINNAWQYGLILAGGIVLALSLVTALGSKTIWTTAIAGLESQKQALQIQAAQNANCAQNYYNYKNAYQNYSNDWDALFGSLRTYNDNLVLMIDELEETLPEDTSVVGIQISDAGLSLELASHEKEEAAYTIMALRDLKYAELLDISDLAKPVYEQAPTVGSGTDILTQLTQSGLLNESTLTALIASGKLDSSTIQSLVSTGVISETMLQNLVSNGAISKDTLQTMVNNGVISKDKMDKLLSSSGTNSDKLLGDLISGNLTEETLFSVLANMDSEQVNALEDAYSPVPEMLNDYDSVMSKATFEDRKVAFTTMLTKDPIAMFRFFTLFKTDYYRDVDNAVLHPIIYAEIQNNSETFASILAGDMKATKEALPLLLDIITKNNARLSSAEKLMTEDSRLLKRYTYYLAVEMGILETPTPPPTKPDDILGDLGNGDNGIFDDFWNDLFGDKNDTNNTGNSNNQNTGNNNNSSPSGGIDLNEILKDYFNQQTGNNSGMGNLGNLFPVFPNYPGNIQYPTQPVDERYHYTVVLGYKPELIIAERERKGLDYDAKIAELEVAE